MRSDPYSVPRQDEGPFIALSPPPNGELSPARRFDSPVEYRCHSRAQHRGRGVCKLLLLSKPLHFRHTPLDAAAVTKKGSKVRRGTGSLPVPCVALETERSLGFSCFIASPSRFEFYRARGHEDERREWTAVREEPVYFLRDGAMQCNLARSRFF